VMFKIKDDVLYERNMRPFNRSWEDWASVWCKWMLSIPKKKNPALDKTGENCSTNQSDEYVWFLTGTFGNIVPVKRRCTIPSGKSIFFPILVKEDSLKEDFDLKTEEELIKRCSDATDRLIYMEAKVDWKKVNEPEKYRAQSKIFDLWFPEDNVYDVSPGWTRSVCDGYWLFIKPLEIGKHFLNFRGETLLEEPHTLDHLKTKDVYRSSIESIDKNKVFRLEVSYELTIV
jgi:hypothetical protein